MSASTDVSSLVAQLANADARTRASAAAELYRQGRALGDSATEAWRADRNFSALLAGPPTVGIAVRQETFARVRAAFGSPHLADVPQEQDAQEFELRIRTGAGIALLDIITTRTPDANSAIARFLEKFGEGIQQVEYPVRDVDAATELLRNRFGARSVYPQTRPGADGTRVNFFLVCATEGKKVLIELVESPR